MRSLDTPDGRYTAAQVEAAYLRSTGVLSCHFDVLDRAGNVSAAASLTPVVAGAVTNPFPGGVLAAQVSFDSSKQVRKDLTMRLFPVAALASAPYAYFIRPWLDLAPMPDGGTASLPMGTYVWTVPTRTVQAVGPNGVNAEVWDVSLGDRQHLLDARGPGPEGLSFLQGTLTVDAVKVVLGRLGITDFSRVQPSASILGGNMYFELATGDTAAAFFNWNQAFLYSYIASLYHVDLGGGDYRVSNSPTPETLAKVVDLLTDGIGYDRGYFDLSDRFVAQPPPGPGTQPAVTYTAEYVDPTVRPAPVGSRVNLVLGQPQITPDLSQLCNRVIVRGSNPSAGTSGAVPVGVADMDVYMPSHPLAHANVGFYIDKPVENSAIGDSNSANALAYQTLVTEALKYEKVTLDTFAYPTHEGNELVGLKIPGDVSYGTTQTMREESWSLDLMGGRMTHVLKRTFT